MKPSIFFNRAIATFTPKARHMNSIAHNVYIYLYIRVGNRKRMLTYNITGNIKRYIQFHNSLGEYISVVQHFRTIVYKY